MHVTDHYHYIPSLLTHLFFCPHSPNTLSKSLFPKMLSFTTALLTLASLASAASLPSPINNSHQNVPSVRQVDWQTLGCMVDQPARTLNGPSTTDVTGMTWQKCFAFCQDYKYAGLEYGQECWCGNSFTNNSPIDPGFCHIPCAGDNHQFCGDSWRLTVFANPSH